MKLKTFAKALWTDDRGQSTTEYILILAVVVMIALKFKSTFGTQLSNIVNQLGGEVQQAVQSDATN